MCGREREGEDEAAYEDDRDNAAWNCKLCSFENEPDSEVCAMCDGAADERELGKWAPESTQVTFRFKPAQKAPKKKRGAKAAPVVEAPKIAQATPKPLPPVVEKAKKEAPFDPREMEATLVSIFSFLLSRELAASCLLVSRCWHRALCGPRAAIFKERALRLTQLSRKLPACLVPQNGQAWCNILGSSLAQSDSALWFSHSGSVAFASGGSANAREASLVCALGSTGRLSLWSSRLRTLKDHRTLAYSASVAATFAPASEGIAFSSCAVCCEVERAVIVSPLKTIMVDLSGFEKLANTRFTEAAQGSASKLASLPPAFEVDLQKSEKRLSEDDKEELDWWKRQGRIVFADLCLLPDPTKPEPQPAEQPQEQQGEPEEQPQGEEEQQGEEEPQPEEVPQGQPEEGHPKEQELPSPAEGEEEWTLIDLTPKNSEKPELASAEREQGEGEKQEQEIAEEVAQEPKEEGGELKEGEGDSTEEEEEEEEPKAEAAAEVKEGREARPFEHPVETPRRQGLLVVGFSSGYAELRCSEDGNLLARLSFGAGQSPAVRGAQYSFQLSYPHLIRSDGKNVLVVDIAEALARAARQEEGDAKEQASPQEKEPEKKHPVLSRVAVDRPGKIAFVGVWTSAGRKSLVTRELDGTIRLWGLSDRSGSDRVTIPDGRPGAACVHISDKLGLLLVEVRTILRVYDLTKPTTWNSPLSIRLDQAGGSVARMHAEKDYLLIQWNEGLFLYFWSTQQFRCVAKDSTDFQVLGRRVVAKAKGYIQVIELGSSARLNRMELVSQSAQVAARESLPEPAPQNDPGSEFLVRFQRAALHKAKREKRIAQKKLVYKAQNRARMGKYIDE